MLFISPILLLGGYTIIPAKKNPADTVRDFQFLRWLRVSLAIAACANIAVFLFFFDAAERYTVEMVGLAIPLLLIGLWEGYTTLSDRKILRRVYVTFAFLVGGISIINSSLLAVSSVQDRFLNGNPLLMQKLVNFLLH